MVEGFLLVTLMKISNTSLCLHVYVCTRLHRQNIWVPWILNTSMIWTFSSLNYLPRDEESNQLCSWYALNDINYYMWLWMDVDMQVRTLCSRNRKVTPQKPCIKGKRYIKGAHFISLDESLTKIRFLHFFFLIIHWYESYNSFFSFRYFVQWIVFIPFVA